MKKSKNTAMKAKAGASPSQLIDARIEELDDWRGVEGAYSRRRGPEHV